MFNPNFGRLPYAFKDALCKKESPKAILIEHEKGKIWIPRKVIHEDSEVCKIGQKGKCLVHIWWAHARKLV